VTDKTGFTLNKLADARRGTARSVTILIRMPDGSLREIDHVASTTLKTAGGTVETPRWQGQYAIVLVVT
jgi:hypothetical protein